MVSGREERWDLGAVVWVGRPRATCYSVGHSQITRPFNQALEYIACQFFVALGSWI